MLKSQFTYFETFFLHTNTCDQFQMFRHRDFSNFPVSGGLPDSYPVAIYESGGKGEKIGFY